MNNHEKQIVDFLTETENFRSMLSIIERFNKVKEHLLTEFWDLVELKINKLIEADGTKWKTWVDGILPATSKLYIYKPEWIYDTHDDMVDLSVCFQALSKRVRYGIWINEKDTKRQDVESMRNYFKTKPEYSDANNEAWWPLYTVTDYDFSVNEKLELILPENRESLADELANTLYGFAKNLEGELDNLFKLKKI